MYEESLRMPFVVRWPAAVKAGSVDTHLVQNLDFAATFLEAAGVAVPADIQGRSLVPLLRGENPADWRRAIYYHYYEFPAVHMVAKHEGVRTDRHKLIHYYELGEWELFDLQTDPRELASKYDDASYRQVLDELRSDLAALRRQYGVDKHAEPPASRKP
jgi:arylsulfatase A-like enzyme